MFTGIIEKKGFVKNIVKKKDTYSLSVSSGLDLSSVKIGDSISVNGVCLTVTKKSKDMLFFDVMGETFKSTSFSDIKKGDVVNIERAVKADSRIEGHFVLGHVDGTRKIKEITHSKKPYIDIEITPNDRKNVVRKGSVAIDGISLTIGEVYEDKIRLHIIPHTLENTNLKNKKKNDKVNVEFDILGKYIQEKSLLEDKPPITEKLLREKGFV